MRSHVRHGTRRCGRSIRPGRWQMVVIATLLILLTPCFAGKRKVNKERDAAIAGSRFRLGSRYLQDGELRRSLTEFLESVRLQPRSARYQHALGLAYFFVDQTDLAEEHLRKAIKLDPGFTEAHHGLALVLSALGEYDEAEEAYKATLADPTYLTPEKVYLNWGKTLERKGDAEGAEEKMRQAIKTNPRYIRGYRELGHLLMARGADVAALEAYLKAYAGQPELAELNLRIGELYLRQGRSEKARPFLQKVLDTAPPESSEAVRAEAFLHDLTAG